MTGNGEDEALAFVGLSRKCEVVGCFFGLEVSLQSIRVDCAVVACCSDALAQLIPRRYFQWKVLLHVVVSSENQQDLVHLGNDGSESFAA